MIMNKTYIKGVGVFALIFAGNALMNKALTPKIETTKYHYTLGASQLDLKKGAIYTLSSSGDDASKIKWLSSNNTIATISKKGQIIAKKAGQTIISAKVHHEYKDIIVNVFNTASADVLIHNDAQVTATKSEALDKISLSQFKLTLSSNTYTYDGKAKKPKVQVEANNNKILTNKKDYKVRYEHNKKAGNAKVIVTGKGKYTGTLVGSFKIEKAASDENTTAIANNDTSVVASTNERIVTPAFSSYTYNYSATSNLTPTTPTYTPVKQKITVSVPKQPVATSKKKETQKAETATSKKKKSNTNNGSEKKETSSNASTRSETASSASNGTSVNYNNNTTGSSSNAPHTSSNTTGSNTSSNTETSNNSSQNQNSSNTSNATSNTTSNTSDASSSSGVTSESDSVVA